MAKPFSLHRFDGQLNVNWAILRSRQASWLRKSDILALALGTCLIAAATFWLQQLDRRKSVEFWKTQVSVEGRYRTWTLRNSLQESQDDMQVLADFAPTGELLLLASHDHTRPLPSTDAVKQVTGLFENYRKVYEYSAIYLLDAEGEVLAQATNPGAWSGVIRTQGFRGFFHEAVRAQHNAVDFVPVSAQQLSLAFVMPVVASGPKGKDTLSSLGFVAMLSPLDSELIPLLEADRLLTRTGEARLLQLRGTTARYVSPARFLHFDQAGFIRQPDTVLRTAASAVEDHPVVGDFIDDQGNDVMAWMQKLPGLNAVVVAKVDKSEAFADVHRTAGLEVVAAAAALLAYIGVILLHRRSAVARKMKRIEESLTASKVTLETKVAERTTELAALNAQLHRELGERKRAEDEVRELNSKLDQRVRDRSAELEASNKELDAFAYTVSHDLRTPLRAIDGFSGILLAEYSPQLPGEAQRYLCLVRQQTRQMARLIDSLLSFARLNRLALRTEPIALADLVRQAWANLCNDQGAKTAQLTIGALPPCEGDPVLLKQVFVNLLSNALKYTRMRAIAKIEVGCTVTGAYYVRDNGVGFDMCYCDKLFGVFQRLHPAEDYEGNGVGLAIVRRVVQRHGGRIWAEAEVNQGATFYITLVTAGFAQQTKSVTQSAGRI